MRLSRSELTEVGTCWNPNRRKFKFQQSSSSSLVRAPAVTKRPKHNMPRRALGQKLQCSCVDIGGQTVHLVFFTLSTIYFARVVKLKPGDQDNLAAQFLRAPIEQQGIFATLEHMTSPARANCSCFIVTGLLPEPPNRQSASRERGTIVSRRQILLDLSTPALGRTNGQPCAQSKTYIRTRGNDTHCFHTASKMTHAAQQMAHPTGT